MRVPDDVVVAFAGSRTCSVELDDNEDSSVKDSVVEARDPNGLH